MIRKNKKGFLGDVGFIIAILFLVGLLVMVGYKVYTSYNEKWQDMPSIANESKALVQENKDRYVDLFDGIFTFVFALLCVALFVSAVNLNTQPHFFFITIIILVFMIGAAAIISNSYETVSNSDQLNDTSSEFTFIPFIMDQLPIIVLFLGFLVITALYVKIKGLI